jgi:hypothetical protein
MSSVCTIRCKLPLEIRNQQILRRFGAYYYGKGLNGAYLETDKFWKGSGRSIFFVSSNQPFPFVFFPEDRD